MSLFSGSGLALAIGALLCSSVAEGVPGLEGCSAGSCIGAGLLAEQDVEGGGGMHLLQTSTFGKRPFLERTMSPEYHCWDHGLVGQPSEQIYLLHLPKTAACSLIVDLNPILSREKLYSDEKCFSLGAELGFKGVMTAFRNPRSHVLSQYFECATSDDWIFNAGSIDRVPKRFDDYVHTWAMWQEQGNVSGHWGYASDPFQCYRPISLQATRYTCSKPEEYPEVINVKEAVNNMMNTEYVGIVEAYQETLCLFHAKLTGALPPYCDCSDAAAWGSFQQNQETHGGSPHSLGDYTENVLADIDSITYADRVLYRAAVTRFQGEIREVEKQFGTKIMCKDLAKDPALQYVLAPLGA